ncbi:laccase, partial [Biomphalaria glabrata]
MMWSRLLAALMLSVFTDNAMSACPKDKNVCEYWLEVESFMTMMDYKTAVYASGGKLYHFNVTNTTLETHISDTNVITADGWENQRLVIAVNKTIPGPTIEVYEGQTVVVHVKNKLMASGISIHWHGLHQKGTVWSDGVSFITQVGDTSSLGFITQVGDTSSLGFITQVGDTSSLGFITQVGDTSSLGFITQVGDTSSLGFITQVGDTSSLGFIIQVGDTSSLGFITQVGDTSSLGFITQVGDTSSLGFITQCPILPGQTFTYRFVADPKGTFWYHAHTGTQLSMGLLGPFIVRENQSMPMGEEMGEHIMMLQDWNHDMDAELLHHKMLYGNFENRTRVEFTGSLEGGNFSMFKFHSGLINGKGRYFKPDGTFIEAPLSVFTVEQSKSYRFRVIGAGNLYPFRVSIDGHPLKIVATDGNEVDPLLVESFIINPGERYDFVVVANQSIDNYWIRGETLEVNVKNHTALAIFRYANAPDTDPLTKRRQCLQSHKCLVANCPFLYYPETENTTCVNQDKFKSLENTPVPDSDNIEEIFLNFAFPGPEPDEQPTSVNGRHFVMPHVSALTQWNEINTFCKPDECGQDKTCECTYSMDLKYNKVYQLIFLNMGRGKGYAHPVHLHGHYFHILKIGYPQYDDSTGKIIQDNLDIQCDGDQDREKSFCNSASWANRSWGGNNIPGLQLTSPTIKDTIIVQTGG